MFLSLVVLVIAFLIVLAVIGARMEDMEMKDRKKKMDQV
jgi:hypothetical protein